MFRLPKRGEAAHASSRPPARERDDLARPRTTSRRCLRPLDLSRGSRRIELNAPRALFPRTSTTSASREEREALAYTTAYGSEREAQEHLFPASSPTITRRSADGLPERGLARGRKDSSDLVRPLNACSPSWHFEPDRFASVRAAFRTHPPTRSCRARRTCASPNLAVSVARPSWTSFRSAGVLRLSRTAVRRSAADASTSRRPVLARAAAGSHRRSADDRSPGRRTLHSWLRGRLLGHGGWATVRPASSERVGSVCEIERLWREPVSEDEMALRGPREADDLVLFSGSGAGRPAAITRPFRRSDSSPAGRRYLR